MRHASVIVVNWVNARVCLHVGSGCRVTGISAWWQMEWLLSLQAQHSGPAAIHSPMSPHTLWSEGACISIHWWQLGCNTTAREDSLKKIHTECFSWILLNSQHPMKFSSFNIICSLSYPCDYNLVFLILHVSLCPHVCRVLYVSQHYPCCLLYRGTELENPLCTCINT